jgi:serine/threonine-protein kinase
VFTIGVIAYEMLTGRLPYEAASLPELIGRMLQAKPATLPGDVPASASVAIMQAIESNPAKRFESARQFADALG